MKYPNIIFFRFKKYSDIDNKLLNNSQYECNFNITDNVADLNKLFNPNYHLLITYGIEENEYHSVILPNLIDRLSNRWIHKTSAGVNNIEEFNRTINYCYIHNVISSREIQRPTFSIFTSCYNTWEKFDRVYNSILAQTLCDWEWVIIEDTPINTEKNHFDFLREKCKNDSRIRLYCRSENSGNIGNVKNEAIALCRGKYLLELDHDDEILPDCLQDAIDVFENDKDIGFIYMDFANIYENKENFKYGNFLCKGYGGYYCQKYNNRWIYVYITPNINNITLSALVCCPNHPRIWRKNILLQLESYSEFLPICDDYEILLRTAISTKVAKIHKLAYIQYMNNDNNNFSLIRNSEINRIGPKNIFPQFYEMYNVHKIMKKADAYENEDYMHYHSKIWERENYTHNYCNQIINSDYDKQYCLIGIETLEREDIKELYKNSRNDFIVLSNKNSIEEIIEKIEDKEFYRMKCYSLLDTTNVKLENYFNLLCKHNSNYEILYPEKKNIIFNIDNLNIDELNKEYTNNEPVNHIILDNLIEKNFLNIVKNDILKIPINLFEKAEVYGIKNNVSINKYFLQNIDNYSNIKFINDYFNSDKFLLWLEKLTNIKNLKLDNDKIGAGIHLIKKGGYLNLHEDSLIHINNKKFRRLNLILYLNDNYDNESNGKLEFWNNSLTKCEKIIDPIFNRIIIFDTINSYSWTPYTLEFG